MNRTFDPLVLVGLAAEQWGLITTAQAGALGVSAQQVARMASTGILERLRHGVYRLAGNPPSSLDDVRAAWLGLDPAITAAERITRSQPEVLSHRSAAHLRGLGDLEADVIEFTVAGRKQSRSSDVRFHVDDRLQRCEWTLVDGLPVTTIETTIGQLAAERLDGGHLAGVVRDALVTHHLGIEAITAVLRPFAHHYGTPLGAGAEFLNLLLDQAGIPETTRRIGAQAERNDNLAGLAAAFGRMPMLDSAERASLAAVAVNFPLLDRSAGAAISAAVGNFPLLDSSVTAAFLAAAAKDIPQLDPSFIAGLHTLGLSAAMKDTVDQLGKLMTPQVTAQLAALLRDAGRPGGGSTTASAATASAAAAVNHPASATKVQLEASKPTQT